MSTWNGSKVMEGFAKIASESGLISSNLSPKDEKDYVGNPSSDIDIIPRYEKTEEYGVKPKTGLNDETGEKLIEKAHKKPITIADSQGEGALVENLIEQQKRDIEIALKMPNGTLVGIHASVIKELVKQAEILEKKGNKKAALMIDIAVQKMIKKTAFPFLIAGILAALGTGYGTYLFSTQDALAEDIKDLLEVANKVDDSDLIKLVNELNSLLTPYEQVFGGPQPSSKDKQAVEERIQKLNEFGPVLHKASTIIDAIFAGASKWWPFGARQRLKGQLNTLEQSYNVAMKRARAVALIGHRSNSSTSVSVMKSSGNNIADVQQVLGLKQTGKLDSDTKNALNLVAKKVKKVFAKGIKEHDWDISNFLIKSNGTIIKANKLRRLIDLTKERSRIK